MIIRYKNEDLIGKKFGKLTILEIEYKYDKHDHKERYCKCICDCGNVKSINLGRIIQGITSSCGCNKIHQKTKDLKRHFTNEDLIGKKFGRLTILTTGHKIFGKFKKRYAHCVCDCGNEIDVRTSDLYSGRTKSCGCLLKEKIVECNTSHGKSGERICKIYYGMIKRCSDTKCKNYGGRGIKVCEEWFKCPEEFIDWSLNNGYREDLTLDRIDVNGDYCSENCRWVDMHIQNTNKRKQKSNTSGYVGVMWNKNNKNWRSGITVRGVKHNLGSFKSKKDAVEARNKFIVDNNLTEYKIQEWRGE